MPQEIVISPEHRARLRRALDDALPQECCGVLLGSNDRGRPNVRAVINTLNAATVLGGFAIPDQEIERVRLVAARRREPIIALFHSHPDGPTTLSDADRATLAYSEWPWVIITQAATDCDVDCQYHAMPANNRQL